MRTYYQTVEPHFGPPAEKTSALRFMAVCTLAAVFSCLVTFLILDTTAPQQIQAFVLPPRVQGAVQPRVAFAAKSPFSFGKAEDQTPPAKATFTFNMPGTKREKPATVPAKTTFDSNEALESVGKITAVGAKVVSELALYLAFNTAYFITNTYQFLSKEEQRELAKQTVDKQLPELLSLLGGTTETFSKTASAVAQSDEYRELQRQASEVAQNLTKGIKTDTPAPEVLQKLKQIVADEKGEVLSEERKSAIAETLKKGGIKGAELSLYLFYNVFSVLKNLDKVLPTPDQTGGIEAKIEDLEAKLANLAEQVKQLPSQSVKVSQKIDELRKSIPTAEELANLDPAEVSMAVRASLASAKASLDRTVQAINAAMKEDSDFRKTLQDILVKLQPLSDILGKLLERLPLPKKVDGSIDYSKLLADSGIITIKGVKALIEATKKAANSVQSKAIEG